MKIRNGFVSNSSSSSFVIDPTKLNELQLNAVKKFAKIITSNPEYCDPNVGCYRFEVDEDMVLEILDAFNIPYESDQ